MDDGTRGEKNTKTKHRRSYYRSLKRGIKKSTAADQNDAGQTIVDHHVSPATVTNTSTPLYA